MLEGLIMSDNLQLKLEDTGDFGIDYFTISFRPEESILQILVGSLRSHLEHSGYRLTPSGKSFFGYQTSYSIVYPCLISSDKEKLLPAGVLAYSPDVNDNYTPGIVLSLTGLGCEDFDFLRFMFFYNKEVFKARITRFDVKKDYFNRELVFEDFLNFYQQGLFAGLRGGSPRHNLIAPKDIEGNKKGGYTLYVGKRGAWRFCRVYEKHHQMAAAGVQLPFSQLRFEIEFRSNNDIEIPLNVFENISGYVQQAYPRLYEKLLCAIPEPFKTKTQFKTKAFEVPLYALIQHLKNTYGGVVHAMELNGMSAEQIVASLTKDKLPKRLLFPVPKTR